ncbi:type IV secretory system conjugative DNA transfer family protein (plasmid) [Moraxella bovis]|uniref:type IV secretory system conjugative DNA transfer family protein n=1 Tax=Moraxella bovis TaxID=476 RepID=UPI0022262ACC|nr:type IV secretory system conjugative DNA transfer family protein [Moraxella bovis]UZA49978.1 type IV secretory system conjugative DNA transfer family protein [Moraxella bovis]
MSDRKPAEYLIVIIIANIIFVAVAWFFANFVFLEWQKIPTEHFGYDTILKYQDVYGHIDKVAKAIKGSLFAGAVLWAVLNIVLLSALFGKPKRELHGSARFANDAEIRRAGFLPNDKERTKLQKKKPSNPSILIGKHKGKFLEFFGNEFMFVAAPTRSGKGVAIVIPNLLHYPDSVMVLDVKNENWDLTAGFRAKYQDVYLFSPNPTPQVVNGEKIYRSHRYNPLDYISRDEFERMKDIGDIANIFFPANSGNDTSDYFNSQAQRLFTGLVLYMIETPERPCTLAELMRIAESPVPLNDWIVQTIEQRKSEGRELSAECVQALMSYAGNPAENTRGGIDSTMKAPLIIFTDPVVASATSYSDFRLDEVRKKKMTIYVGIQPNALPRFSKLLNIMFSQLLGINTQVLPEQDPSLRHQCLVLLDEFTALGKIEIVQKSVAFMAGYNMRLMLIFQSKSQVEGVYGKEGAKDIFANMACQVEYTPTEQDQAEELSRKLGTETVKGKSVSRNRGKGGGGSVSTSDQSRALMLPQELKEMDAEKEIIIFRRTHPIFCDKAFYYTSPDVFGKRMKRVEEPAQGLDIPAKHQPPILDIKETLKIMRGLVKDPADHYSKLPTTEKLQETNPEYLAKVGESFGFNEDFLKYLDSLSNEAVKEMVEKERVNNNSIELDENPNEVDFDLDDPNEFDPDFIQEVYDEFAGLF